MQLCYCLKRNIKIKPYVIYDKMSWRIPSRMLLINPKHTQLVDFLCVCYRCEVVGKLFLLGLTFFVISIKSKRKVSGVV